MIELGVICIVNENDVVATDELGELTFGDNDNLSAMVANLVDADLLALLTDIDGLYNADPACNPQARLIPRIEKIDAEIERVAGDTANSCGVGGMITKLEAAKLATASGVTVVIANGRKPDVLNTNNTWKKHRHHIPAAYQQIGKQKTMDAERTGLQGQTDN